MRFLIAFILLFGLNFSLAHAIENKNNAVIKTASAKSFLSSKKEAHSLNGSLFIIADRIHQNINHHILCLPAFANTWNFLNTPVKKNLRRFKKTTNFSYQFIFNCLFPKHTFW